MRFFGLFFSLFSISFPATFFLKAIGSEVSTAVKNCKKAFGSCRKYEDDVLKAITSCSKVGLEGTC